MIAGRPLTGHTDTRDTPAYNRDLAERLAESVRQALAGRLGGDFAVQAGGKGEDEGRARNRRVEITYPT
jgi:outer membrane protein OmpA-like peptidoglycan-associated protein